MTVKDTGYWRVKWTLDKYHEDITPYRGREQEFYAQFTPYETVVKEGNLLLNEGINEIWKLVRGTGGTAYSEANARIGVGSSTQAAAATDTGLIGGSQSYRPMDAGFPPAPTNQKIIFKASWGSGVGEFAWNEWTVDNGAVGLINLNRKVEALGTKPVGVTWTLTVEISLV